MIVGLGGEVSGVFFFWVGGVFVVSFGVFGGAFGFLLWMLMWVVFVAFFVCLCEVFFE